MFLLHIEFSGTNTIITRYLVFVNHILEFFDKKVTERTGLISKNEKETTFKGVVSVNIQQSFWGRIFNFGDVYIDLVGKNNLILEGIAKPYELKKFLETKLVDDSQTTIIA